MDEVFIETSSDTYDRHTYRVILKEGDPVPFEFYEDAQNYWYALKHTKNLITIEVLDKPKRRTKAKGF